MSGRVYISSPLGFTDAGCLYYEALLNRLSSAGFEPLDPWTFDDGESTKARQAYAELAGGRAPIEIASEIGARNARLVDEADAVLAVLDGADVDSGVACEVGYAMARGKPIVGLRTDRRRSGDGTGISINLQVLYAVLRHDRSDYARSVEEAIQGLRAAVGPRTSSRPRPAPVVGGESA